MELLQKLIKYSNQHNLIVKDDSILIALSGGADSVALLHLLAKLRTKKKLTISAVYVNHQLRKKAADKEELFCQTFCDSLDIELHLASVDITALAKQNKKGIEETAREYRYDLFETLAQQYNYTKVALGHHQNDNVETILFRIFRGTGKEGLKGIPPKRDIFIRPMLAISKDEILAYIKLNKLTFCQDTSNFESIFKRNYIRNKLIPLLKTNLNQSVEKALLNLSDTISDEELFLDSIVKKRIKKILSVSVGNKLILKKDLYVACDRWVRRRVLRHCIYTLSDKNLYPNKETVENLDSAILSGKKTLSIPQKLEMSVVSSDVVLSHRTKLKFKQRIDLTGSCNLKKLTYIVKSKTKKKTTQSLKLTKNGMIGRFDLNKLEKPLIIRSIEDGDRFRPLGMKGTKKIGNYLTDIKIHRLFRDEIPIMADKNSVFWVVGHQIDERVKIDKNTTEVLEIEFRRKK